MADGTDKPEQMKGAAKPQSDLFSEAVVLQLPPRFALRGRVLQSPVEQILTPAVQVSCRLDPFTVKRVGGFETTLPSGERLRIIGRKTATTFGDDLVLLVPGVHPKDVVAALEREEGVWVNPAPVDPATLTMDEIGQRLTAAVASWEDAFQLREARAADGQKPATRGLRRPQVGALHAALAHATRSTAAATIVMPTGTGKTETMLALEVLRGIERLLVVVPTDALRDQIAGKFQTLGVLKDQECLAAAATYPVVVRLSHIPNSIAEVDELFGRANVIVTTMHIAGRASAQVQERMAERASALFIDEAHHIGARTWAEFRALFVDRAPPIPVVQFTATPFREDGRRVDGEFIYTYPLKKAQEEGYFKRIRFEAVFGLDRPDADIAIAEKLGEVLDADLEAGLNHLAMSRCQTIERAKDLLKLYTDLYPQHRPVIVHSQQSARQRRENLAALRRFDSRIVVCVDMLGEGFDLPELKIAALHDHHKSVAVTIQFVGRFTRPDPKLGDATVIANTGVDDVDRSLAKLYAEDADWNALVEALSSAKIERQVRRAEMFKGFVGDLNDIPLQTLDPKMNAIVYSTRCSNWAPQHAGDLYDAGVYLGMKVNPHQRVAIFVTRVEEQAPWTTAAQAIDVTWDLHMLHWDEAKNLLYISSSSKGPFDRLAAAVCGEETRRIQGEDVFRCLHGFKRLIIRNLGLTHHQGRGVRFSMYMGVDVAEGMDSAKSQARIKNNVFGAGFLNGAPASLGCSAKGKFWSLLPVRDLTDWVDWCQDIGRTVTDPGITTDGVFKSAMRPRLISERPAAPPVAIHWPESLLWQLEERVEIAFDGIHTLFTECDIELADHNREGPLRFVVKNDSQTATFEIVFGDGAARYPQRSGPKATIKLGGKERPLSQYFADDSPHIDFGDGSLLIYCHLYALPEGEALPPYPPEKIETWDWSRANIRVESQGVEKRADSVQRMVIEKLLAASEPYGVIFDDDGAGEIADVVAIRVTESVVYVSLYHCKYSSKDEPGARVKDLYEVCGQAQKSARWRDRPNRMLQHMLKREKLRLDRSPASRFDLGNPALIKKLKAVWQDYRYEYDVRIVQPGLSKAAVGEEGLHLLAGAETYLLETRAMPLRIIGSA
jgi:superfamily II DNA or RNA helicase